MSSRIDKKEKTNSLYPLLEKNEEAKPKQIKVGPTQTEGSQQWRDFGQIDSLKSVCNVSSLLEN